MTNKHIIIQNFFRSGGSYLYDAFNTDPNIIGFYEPFHENLSSKEKISSPIQLISILFTKMLMEWMFLLLFVLMVLQLVRL